MGPKTTRGRSFEGVENQRPALSRNCPVDVYTAGRSDAVNSSSTIHPECCVRFAVRGISWTSVSRQEEPVTDIQRRAKRRVFHSRQHAQQAARVAVADGAMTPPDSPAYPDAVQTHRLPSAEPLALSYVLPLRTADNEPIPDLAQYLKELAGAVDEVVVVDGSSAATVAQHRAQLGSEIRVVAPDNRTLMGKVGNVMTGVRHARHDCIVIADDDVRYTPCQLAHLIEALDSADVVRPQNYFDPLPWHARFDTARILLNRVTGGDWPGTLAVRRPSLLQAGGYSGDVMFENFELVRTLRAAGGRERLLLDVVVRRRPPTTSHLWAQQVRQAYDEMARPPRLAFFLAILPGSALALKTGRRGALTGLAAATVAVAEIGRRRRGSHRVFPASSSVLVPLWLLWRSGCSWAAVAARLRGGVRYRDVRIRRAATPMHELRARVEPLPNAVPSAHGRGRARALGCRFRAPWAQQMSNIDTGAGRPSGRPPSVRE